jgi:hypothetical protein
MNNEMTMFFDMSMVVAMGVFTGQLIFNTSEALLKRVILVAVEALDARSLCRRHRWHHHQS